MTNGLAQSINRNAWTATRLYNIHYILLLVLLPLLSHTTVKSVIQCWQAVFFCLRKTDLQQLSTAGYEDHMIMTNAAYKPSYTDCRLLLWISCILTGCHLLSNSASRYDSRMMSFSSSPASLVTDTSSNLSPTHIPSVMFQTETV